VNEKRSYEELIGKYLAAEISSAEREELFLWVNASEENRTFFNEMLEIWSLATEYETPAVETNLEAAWEATLTKINPPTKEIPLEPTHSSAKVVRLSKSLRFWRIAAVLLLLLSGSLWVVYNGNSNTTEPFLAQTDEQKSTKPVILPDGSEVWLNERSQLSYIDQDGQRQVSLKGEAFFEVASDSTRPFIVYAGDAVTEVLGTSFNLRAYPEEPKVEITVKTGKVAFRAQTTQKDTLKLPAGTSAIYSTDAQEITETPKEEVNATSWKTDVLRFENLPVKEVLDDLERYFHLSFKTDDPGLLDCSFRSNFENPDLSEVLGTLKFILKLDEVEQTENGVVLKGKGCNPN